VLAKAFSKFEVSAFVALALITIGCLLTAVFTEQYYLAFIPFGLLIAAVTVINFRAIYFLLLFTIPLSMEYYFSDTLATDLPDELLMVGLMLVTLLFLLSNRGHLPKGFFTNTLIIALMVHIFWIFIAAINSVDVTVSIKSFISKMWYVTSFVVLTSMIVKEEKVVRTLFWCMFIPLTFAMLTVFIRYGIFYKFAFEDMNKPMWPFFRNHVNYAAILSVFFPFILLARTWYERGSFKRRILTLSLLLYVVAIYFSYTRTCMIAIMGILPMYLVIKYKLVKPALVVVGIGVSVLLVNLFTDNRYLRYAPDFEKTVYHDDFTSHITSTFEGQDVSSMERVYRWVAGIHMFRDRPLTGFGPSNFYPYYKRYSVSSFETYISDNEERSTMHNYFLLTLVEQGITGLVIFLLLTITIFVYGEKVYHRISNVADKRVVMACLLVLAMVYVNLLLSDLMEADKVGPFFFICVSIIAVFDLKNRNAEKVLSS
jgi:O-antigen ligase